MAGLNLLVLNVGSSSLKWSRFDGEVLVADGNEDWQPEDLVTRIGDLLGEHMVDAVGHRITHGGPRFRSSVRVDAAVRAELGSLIPLDALHLGPTLAVVDAVTAARPDLPQIAVFDTTFHATLSEAAFRYAVPASWADHHGIRRYGFHGLSVDWAVSRIATVAGAVPARLIVCHLGSGCSVTAVAAGRSVDTTMGFSPLEGVVMATRSGSIDPGALLHLLIDEKLDPVALRDMLSQHSGWKGVSGLSADLRQVLAAAQQGHAAATVAVDVFVHSLRRAIGAMAGVLGGADAMVFTGAIGEGSSVIRRRAALALPGLELDDTATGSSDRRLSTARSSVDAWLIHAREDLVIRRETARLAAAP